MIIKYMFRSTSKKQQIIKNLAQKYSLELLLLFGSQITGKIHKESDYDIAYFSAKDLSPMEEGRLIIDLLPIIRLSDKRLLNLVSIKKASPLLLYNMTSKAQVLYERKPNIFAGLRAYAFKLYIELKPLYEAKFHRLNKTIQYP